MCNGDGAITAERAGVRLEMQRERELERVAGAARRAEYVRRVLAELQKEPPGSS